MGVGDGPEATRGGSGVLRGRSGRRGGGEDGAMGRRRRGGDGIGRIPIQSTREGGEGDRGRNRVEWGAARVSVGEEIRRIGGVAGWAWWVGPVGGCGLLGRSPVGGGFAFSFF